MPATEIKIPRNITNQLLHLAQLSPEQEICGLIGSIESLPKHCYPVTNCAKTPDSKFQMDPAEQISALAKMRDRDESLFAIYHSHPSTPAVPSATDLVMAAYPEALNLIISLNTKGVLELRGFTIIDQKAEEIPLILG